MARKWEDKHKSNRKIGGSSIYLHNSILIGDAMMNNSGAINGRPQGSVQKTRNGRKPKCRSTTSQLDNDSDDHEKYQDYEENVSSETVASWVLSNDILLSSFNFLNSNIDIFSLTYFGILDLSGEDIEVKNLFTDEEWNEMTQDFKSNVNLNGLEDEQERPIYELMDKITKKPSDLIARIESCVIKLMQLDDLFRHTSFGSNFTNTITRGILTFDQIYHYEEPGGLPSAPKSKKWMVKVDLAVVLQDVLINKGIKTMA
ncbi:72_t:CDS:2 [Entrophospora sp. SA101]|nr:72_t:CDS:2 [Entrophospora sp. SA101]